MTTGDAARPVLAWVEVRGFRSFGTEARRLDIDAPLSVVHGGNSVGKSSLAEAMEFLLTGRSSRRDLLGGAKTEYHGSLSNAHLPAGETEVWVAAGLRAQDGQVHTVRRDLLCDFAQGTECQSRLLVDGVECGDLAAFGLAPAAGSALGAPVLLAHTLRHVLSTLPKDRVNYFKSLLSLTDLDAVRDRVVEARRRLAARPQTQGSRTLEALAGSPFRSVAGLNRATVPATEAEVVALVHDALLDSGAQALGQAPGDLATLVPELEQALAQQRERLFPLSAFNGQPTPSPLPAVDLDGYATALERSDRQAAELAPLFEAVLAVSDLGSIDEPVDCPVCMTPRALTPERLAALRDHLRRGAEVRAAAQHAASALRTSEQGTNRAIEQAHAAVPLAASWTASQVEQAKGQMQALGLAKDRLISAGTAAREVRLAVEAFAHAAQKYVGALRADILTVERRADVDDTGREAARQELIAAVEKLQSAQQANHEVAAALAAVVEPAVETQTASAGLAELLQGAQHADALTVELRRRAAHTTAETRLVAAEKALTTAATAVLDARFERMSDSIAKWWLTIRPEELVGFGGVARQAGGANFVSLRATLRTEPMGAPIERHALGVFSDSQLNALGLSTFLARTELLGTPLVVLDDPIPGSDGDHRLTFVQCTLQGLLDAGIQVILTTHDSKLADWAAAQHAGPDLRKFELTLTDHVAGTEPAQTSDVFDQLMLEAEDSLNAPTAKGRRSACNTYRSAAERLAKQVIATGRTDAGVPTTIDDVEREAKVLGDLAPLVKGYALSSSEKGNWTTFAKILNPGSHDDQVPSTTELKVVRGNLRSIVKAHQKHWPHGLVR